ncbi:MAG: hypothetical protein ACFB10_09285 [Salibacteraceae bacterium]|mgnify:CR=1 FL=1
MKFFQKLSFTLLGALLFSAATFAQGTITVNNGNRNCELYVYADWADCPPPLGNNYSTTIAVPPGGTVTFGNAMCSDAPLVGFALWYDVPTPANWVLTVFATGGAGALTDCGFNPYTWNFDPATLGTGSPDLVIDVQ